MEEVAGFAFVFWTASTSCFTLQLNFRECYAPGNHSIKADQKLPFWNEIFFPIARIDSEAEWSQNTL